MSFDINNNVPKNLFKENLTNDESLAARKAALDLAKHIEQRAEGSRFPGRLRVHNLKAALKGGENPIQVKRANWFKNIFTSTNHVQKSSVYLRSLLGAAYKDKISPEAYEKIMAKVDKHLSKNLGFDGFGSRHFATFVREFESAPQIYNTAGVQYFDAETNTLLSSKSIQGNGPNAKTLVQALADIKTGLSSKSDDGHIEELARGAEGVAFELKINNQDRVIKIYTVRPPEIGEDTLRKGDTVAVYGKKRMPHVIEPSQYFIKVQKQGLPAQVYQVSPNMLKSFVEENKKSSQATGVPTELILLGTEMKKASGQPVSALTKQGPLNVRDFGRLAMGIYLGIEEMKTNLMVHHDIKPANVLFDSQTGTTNLIDLGQAVRLHKNDPQTSERVGNPPFMAPAVLQGLPHGNEVDRFSYAVTLLAALEPKITAPETIRSLSSLLGGGASVLDENGQPKKFAPTDYLDEYLRALDAGSPNNDGSAALRAKLNENPNFQRLIELAFEASAGGGAGDASWSNALSECLPNFAVTNDEIKNLNQLLKHEYNSSQSPYLASIFNEVAEQKGFNYQLAELGIFELSIKIGEIVTKHSKIETGAFNQNGEPIKRPNGRLVSHTDIKDDVKKLVSKFIDSKSKQLNDVDAQNADPDLKALVKKQILLQGGFSDDQFKAMLQVVPLYQQSINAFATSNVKKGFIDFVKTRHTLGSNDSDPDYRVALFSVAADYFRIKNVDIGAALNGIFSTEAKEFYSLFLTQEGSSNNAFVDSLGGQILEEDEFAIKQSMQTDLFVFDVFVNIMQRAQKQESVDVRVGLNAAATISDPDRLLILDLYRPNAQA